MKLPCVYILASNRNGTLYVGVTSDLVRRVWQHKNKFVEGFARQYGVDTLVWYESHETMESAIAREKALKKWRRAWKLELIERENPRWRDLYRDLLVTSIGLGRTTPMQRFLGSRFRGNDGGEWGTTEGG